MGISRFRDRFSMRRWQRTHLSLIHSTSQVPDVGFSQFGFSVPLSNAFNPFTVANATIPNFFPNGDGLPVVTGVRFRAVNDTGREVKSSPITISCSMSGLRGEMGEFADYLKTWQWETGFRYSHNEGTNISIGEASRPGCGRRC